MVKFFNVVNTPSVKKSKPVTFLKEVRAEMERVSWPTKQEAIRLTSIVIGASVVVAIFIGSLDFIFTKLIKLIIPR